MDSLEIGRAEDAEIDELVVLDRECFPLHPYGPVVMRQMFEVCGGLLIRARRGRLVGYCLGAIEFEDPAVGWILSLAVKPESRNKGIGSLLTSALIDQLRTSGVALCRLSVEPGNEAALALYSGFGAQETEFRDLYFGTDPRLLMEFPI